MDGDGSSPEFPADSEDSCMCEFHCAANDDTLSSASCGLPASRKFPSTPAHYDEDVAARDELSETSLDEYVDSVSDVAMDSSDTCETLDMDDVVCQFDESSDDESSKHQTLLGCTSTEDTTLAMADAVDDVSMQLNEDICSSQSQHQSSNSNPLTHFKEGMQLSSTALTTSLTDEGGVSVNELRADQGSSFCSGSEYIVHHLEPAPHNIVNSSDESQDPDGVDPVDGDGSPVESDVGEPSDDPDGDDSDGDDSDGDEPDDEDSDHSDGNSASSESDGENHNYTLGNALLDNTVQFHGDCTLREAVALVTSLSVRKNQDYQTIMEQFSILNTVTGSRQFPTDKRQLWKLLGYNASGMRKHAYCGKCRRSLGRLKNLQPGTVCCGVNITKKNVKYFITLSLKKQFSRFLSTPGARERLRYREDRQKLDPDAIEDIFDGDGYKRLQERENGLRAPDDFSYTFNFDGFTISASSDYSAWGLLLRINELKPNLRQKNFILAALWVDNKKPRFNLFLRRFVKEANELSGEGLVWKPDGINEVRSRIFPTVSPLDAQARCGALQMTQYNGRFGCTYCEHPGIHIGGAFKYPLPGTVVMQRRRGQLHRVEIPLEIPLRTHNGILQTMAEVGRERIRGIIRPSELADLNFFDVARGFSTDDLHPIYSGVTKFHTELLLQACANKTEAIRVIDHRFLSMQLPSTVSRKPRSFTMRRKWHGTEWRNWLQVAVVLCFKGLVTEAKLTHIGMLSEAVFLLSRDIITPASLQEAQRLLRRYTALFQQYYGPESMRFVVHELEHVIECIRNWGSFWCQSTFPYESLNHRLGQLVSSPRGAVDQMINRYLLITLVESCQYRDDISEEVREKIVTLLSPWSPKQKFKIGDVLVYGKGERLALTEQQLALMAEEPLANHPSVHEYKHILVNGCHCRPQSHSVGIKSNDSLIYTRGNLFCEIQRIIVLGNEPNRSVGLFCKLCNVGNAINGVSHIVEVLDMEELLYLPATVVRNSALKVTVTGRVYVSPMPHQNDID